MATRFDSNNSNNTGKGFFNLKVLMASGKKKKLGSVLDYDKLSDSERSLLMKLSGFGADGKSVTIIVDYNEFDDSGDEAEDDFA